MRLREPECLDLGLLIVARDQPELYDYLQSNYGDSTELMILLDRRKGTGGGPTSPCETSGGTESDAARARRTPISDLSQ